MENHDIFFFYQIYLKRSFFLRVASRWSNSYFILI